VAKKNKSTDVLFKEMLGSSTIAKKDINKKKNQIPEIRLNSKDSCNLRLFLKNKKAMKKSEIAMRIAEEPILKLCQTRQDNDAFKEKFAPSYELVADTSETVKFVSLDKFSVPNEKNALNVLKKLLGNEFNKEVIKTSTIALKPEVFQDKKLKKELVDLLGSNFNKFFQTIVSYNMKSGFNERLYKILTENEIKNFRTICKQSKASLK
jgi:hypothetical protein